MEAYKALCTHISAFTVLQDVAAEQKLRGKEALALEVSSLALAAARDSMNVNAQRVMARNAMIATSQEVELELQAYLATRREGKLEADEMQDLHVKTIMLNAKRRRLDDHIRAFQAWEREMCVYTPYRGSPGTTL